MAIGKTPKDVTKKTTKVTPETSGREKDGRFAKGNTLSHDLTNGGRKRWVSPEKEDLIALGQEMLDWVTANDPLHISAWWRAHKGMEFKFWDTISQRAEFIPYHSEAMGKVALNMINGAVHPSIAQRFLRIYFRDLKLEEDEKLDIEYAKKLELLREEIKLKSELNESVEETIKNQFEATMTQLHSLQSDRKQDETSSKAAEKS